MLSLGEYLKTAVDCVVSKVYVDNSLGEYFKTTMDYVVSKTYVAKSS